MKITLPSLTIAGLWKPVSVAQTAVVDFYGVAKLGPQQWDGIVLDGWAYTGFDNTSADVTPVHVAVLAQQPDGTLKVATSDYISDTVTNGAGSIVSADFNGDGKDDIFLGAHNESPFVAESSTAYLSQPDGTFSKVQIADSVMNHDANLGWVGGKPVVFGAGYYPGLMGATYAYDGKGGFTVGQTTDALSAMAVAIGDFAGDGSLYAAYTDVLWAPGIDYAKTNVPREVLYKLVDGKLTGAPIALPAPWFNDKPEYSQYQSFYDPVAKTHSSRIWTDDINHDGKPDLIVGAELWSSATGLEKTQLQILVNQGGLAFTDQTARLNPEYSEDAFNDYSLQMVDLDHSGIKTILIAANPFPKSVNGALVLQNDRQGNYVMLNDGTGRLHVAMHAEFQALGDEVIAALKQMYPAPGYVVDDSTPKFIAYQNAAGHLDFVAEASVSVLEGNQWFYEKAYVNVPLDLDIDSAYTDNLTITDRNGSHLIRTFGGNDVIYSGNDGGYSHIDGGAGMNTVVYRGARAGYTLAQTDGATVVTDTVGADGTDTLVHVQRLQFTDASVALDVSGAAGQAYRLYQAALNRTPDKAGLGYWIAQEDAGMSNVEAAARFIDSTEFRSLYGGASSTSNFVDAIYGNVLHRAPDQGGHDFYVMQIDAGAKSKAQVLAEFSESPENQAQVIGAIQHGIDYIGWAA